MPGDPKITVTVYVSGVDHEVTVNPHQKVEQLIREALREAKIPEPDLAEWNLRLQKGGQPIPHDQKISEAGIEAGSILFLDPDAGGGGARSRI